MSNIPQRRVFKVYFHNMQQILSNIRSPTTIANTELPSQEPQNNDSVPHIYTAKRTPKRKRRSRSTSTKSLDDEIKRKRGKPRSVEKEEKMEEEGEKEDNNIENNVEKEEISETKSRMDYNKLIISKIQAPFQLRMKFLLNQIQYINILTYNENLYLFQSHINTYYNIFN